MGSTPTLNLSWDSSAVRTTERRVGSIPTPDFGVAEMVDALDIGSSILNGLKIHYNQDDQLVKTISQLVTL